MYNQGGFRNFAPVNVGDELDVTIEAVGGKGDGIAKIKGFVIFVPNVKKGDNVKVRITKVLRKVGFGEVVGQGSDGENVEEKEGRKNAQEEDTMEEGEDMNEMPEETYDSEDFGEEN